MGKTIQQILKDPERKNLFKIGADLTRLFLKYKSRKRIDFYATQLMYKKDAGDIKDYLPVKTLDYIKKQYYWKRVTPAIKNKSLFSYSLKENYSFFIPAYLGKIENGSFYDKENNNTPLKDRKQLKDALRNILEKCPSIYIKPVGLSGGRGHQRIDHDSLEKADAIDINEDYIIQETLKQHRDISKIFPNCINSLRVITYRKGDEILFPSCCFAMGVGNAQLSNSSMGGIVIPYNIEKNTLGKIAYNKFAAGGRSFFEHPDTGFKFDGAHLIFADEIKNLLTETSLLFNQEMVGWDIAFTEKGPCILEGNCAPNIEYIQIMNRGLLSNPLYCEIFKDYL